MTQPVPADQIEQLVGARRHSTAHLGRLDAATDTILILHSEKCRASTLDLTTCTYSRALDRGTAHPVEWLDLADRTIALRIASAGRLAIETGAAAETLNVELLLTEPNEPWSVNDMFGAAEVHDGMRLQQVGEDGDWILSPGRVEPDVMVAAMTAAYGHDDFEVEEVTTEWWVARSHRDECLDGVELGDTCSCDEYGAWYERVGQDMPGAVEVTVWSAP